MGEKLCVLRGIIGLEKCYEKQILINKNIRFQLIKFKITKNREREREREKEREREREIGGCL